MRRRKCTLRAHHWGRRVLRRSRRRHRRPHNCTILNHHSFVRSLVRSLANSRLMAHLWGGRGSQARHTPPSLARSLANSSLMAHHWGRTVDHYSFVRSFVRSFSRSPVRSHRSPLGREGSPHGAPYLTTIRCPLARSPNSLPYCKTVRSLVRQLTSHARHWGEGDNTRPPSLARLLANSRLDTGE